MSHNMTQLELNLGLIHQINSANEIIRRSHQIKSMKNIYYGKHCIVALAEVQCVEKLQRNVASQLNDRQLVPNGIYVITSKTYYDMGADVWANPIYISEDEAADFIQAWVEYRNEVEERAMSNSAQES